MKEKLLFLLLALFVMATFLIPVLWTIATVQACGWKGLFVECRIAEVK